MKGLNLTVIEKHMWKKNCLGRYDNMLRKRMSSMHTKQKKKDEKELSLNQEIEFGCIYAKRVFLDIENQTWCLEDMVHLDSLKESMPTKWIYNMSIMLVLYSKFMIFLCLM